MREKYQLGALQLVPAAASHRDTRMTQDESDHPKIGLASIMNQANIGCGAGEYGGFGTDYLE
jgi:hypothetical protein